MNMLLSFLGTFVESFNNGKLPEIMTSWEGLIR